jgi:serine/threonine protein kinase
MSDTTQPRSAAALLIGIGDYLHTDRVTPLRYAARDAQALSALLVDPDVCGFPPDRVMLLTDAEARRDEIVKRLSKWLPEHARGAEIVLLYFAGHGVVNRIGPREEGFLLPQDADPDDLVTRGLAMADLARWLDAIEAKALVLCLDCCHSGRVLTRGTDPAPIATRDMTIRPALLSSLAGRHRYILASCDDGQVSVEAEPLGHGLFTYHLLEGLRGEADRDGDSRVGVAELFEYVAEAVEKGARQLGMEQRPWTTSMGTGGVYLSRPRPRGAASSSISTVSTVELDVVSAAERAAELDDVPALLSALDRLRRIGDPAGTACALKALAHEVHDVRERAKRVIQSIGWERVAAATEAMARGGDTQRMAAVLDGLGAFEAHRDVVALLDRLVALLRAEERTRAILLLERKRLALGLEGVAEAFRALDSPYRLTRVLGQGLYSAAYYAHDDQTDHAVVVRVLRPELATQAEIRARFLDLARRSIKHVHQNLVLTREVRAVPERDLYYVVRDYVDGVTLQRMIDVGTEFAPEQVGRIVQQLLEALTPLHESGVPHGGIKPSNIFVRPGDRVVLGDPAAPVQGPGLALDRLAYDFRYAPPEQFRAGPVGPRADLYALGCVAYELACGRAPFVSDNAFEVATMHAREAAEPPGRRGSRLGPDVDAFVMRLLAKSPEGRFDSLAAALDALGGVLRARRAPPAVSAPPAAERESHGGIGIQPAPRVHDGMSLVSFNTNLDDDSVDAAHTDLSLVCASGPPERLAEPPPERFGRYVILATIGRGGMGTVYRARDEELDRLVAIKRGRPTPRRPEQQTLRFRRETVGMARLSHPNIVTIHDVGYEDGTAYAVLELIEGGSLATRLAAGPITPQAAAELMIPLASAVHYAHEQGIIHRDLKPSNILITADGVPKVSDFGLAKLLGNDPDAEPAIADEALTLSGQFIGTPQYTAPEQVEGKAPIGPATDIFALGVILYEMVTGRRPFQGKSPVETVYQLVHRDPIPLSQLRPDIPRAFEAIVARCLDKLPQRRYQSAAALAEDLSQFLRPPPQAMRARRSWSWRRIFDR